MNKIKSWEALAQICGKARQQSKKIVFTNGCFDILHEGHMLLLQKAKQLGDILIVGLNTDSSVKRLKGSSRPINTEQERAQNLATLDFVGYVTLFEQDTPLELITAIKPDVLVKGGDYANKNCVGSQFVESLGGKTVIIPLVEGVSTTKIIEKLGLKSKV